MLPKKNEGRSVACIIPARYASTRLPGKPLVEIAGKPLIMWAYDQAVSAEVFSTVVIATDDERIRDEVERQGGVAVMTSADHTTGTDRVREAARDVECDYIVNLQGDEPNLPHEVIHDFVRELDKIDDDCLLTCVANARIEETRDPNVVKAVLDCKGYALYFSRAQIPYSRDGQGEAWYRHTGIYGFTKTGLERFCSLPQGKLEQIEKLEQLRALEAGMRIRCIVRDYNSPGIDTPEDVEHFRRNVELEKKPEKV